MLNEVNDGVEQAQELADLTKNIRKLSYVNLIPYNPVSEHDQYSRSPKERVSAFYDVLKKNGVNCVVRQEHGTDIDAACGQLRSNTMKKTVKKLQQPTHKRMLKQVFNQEGLVRRKWRWFFLLVLAAYVWPLF